MQRLTEKDELGNWCLKGVRWEQLRAGQVITKEASERLYGALCKLKDYENTGGNPECIADLIKNYAMVMTLLAASKEEHRWIPATERLPESEDEEVLVQCNGKDGSIRLIDAFVLATYSKEIGWYSMGRPNLEATVTAWMPLPEPYKAEVEERPDAYADWQDHYMDRFEKVE